MRFLRMNRAWALGLILALTACQAPLVPVAAPSSVSQQGLSLRVRPVLNDGMRLLAAPPLKTAADVDALEIHLQARYWPGGEYMPIDAATGEISEETANPLKLRMEGPLDPDLSLTFNHLKAETDYRILARAFDGPEQISDDEQSWAEVSVGNSENLGAVEVPLRIAAPFGAQTKVSMDLWGLVAKVHRIRASLSNPAQGVVAQVDLPRADLAKVMTLASLRANTTYTLNLEVYKESNNLPIATASAIIPVGNEESVASRSISLTIKDDMYVNLLLDYVAVDEAGNVYVTVYKSDTVTDLIRYSRDGATSTRSLPFGVIGFDAAADGTLYAVTRDHRALRFTFDAGDYEVLVPSGAGGLGLDAQGNCYASAANDEIRKFAPGSTTGTVVATNTGAVHAILPAPDGSIYFETHSNNEGLYRVSAPNATPVLVGPRGPSWIHGMRMGDDGKILAAVVRYGLYEIDPLTGERTLLRPYPQVDAGLAKDVKGNFYVTGNGFLRVF